MRKLDISEWSGELERQLAAMPVAINAAALSGAETTVAVAKAKIAHYQPGVGPYPAWKPLAPSTIAEKTRKGYAPPDNPLLRTGELRDSIVSVVKTEKLETLVVVGSHDPVMRYQEHGTDKIPPRPLISPAMLETQPVYQKELARAVGSTLAGDRYAPSTIDFVAFRGDEE